MKASLRPCSSKIEAWRRAAATSVENDPPRHCPLTASGAKDRDRSGEVVHRSTRDTRVPQERGPVRRGAAAERLLQRGDEVRAMRDPVPVAGEPGVGGKFWTTERVAERGELAVVAHREG